MTKDNYLKILNEHLKGIPEKDRLEALLDIEDYFKAGLSDNRQEAEIASALLNPKVLAQSIKAEYSLSDVAHTKSFHKFMSLIGLIISLGFVNIILLPLIFSLVLLVVSFYLVVASFYLTGGLLIVSPLLKLIFPSQVSVPPGIFIYLMPFIGAGTLFLTYKLNKLMNHFSKVLIKQIIKYLKLNHKILTIS